MNEDTINHIQLELHVPDLDVAQDFYKNLGFKILWQRREGNGSDYIVMERNGTILNFWHSIYKQSYFDRFPKNTKRGYGVEIVIPVDNVREFHDKIKEEVNIVNPLVKRPWGVWDFRIEDPFGYYLRITDRHDITSNTYAVPKSYTEE